jgi:hypothetical protein
VDTIVTHTIAVFETGSPDAYAGLEQSSVTGHDALGSDLRPKTPLERHRAYPCEFIATMEPSIGDFLHTRGLLSMVRSLQNAALIGCK